jgi:HAMP domain-containing protein
LIAVAVVALLSNVMVRRTLEPLKKLTDGTRRIAGHDLTIRVEVDSPDEFGELGSSFNTMVERLGHQFRQIEAGSAIDRAVLSAGDRGVAVQALLDGVGGVVESDRLAALLLDSGTEGEATLYSRDSAADSVIPSSPALTEGGHTWLRAGGSRVQIIDAAHLPAAFGGRHSPTKEEHSSSSKKNWSSTSEIA